MALQMRRRRKKPPTMPQAKLHERIALDPPPGAKVVIDVMADPYGLSESATLESKRRSDGSIAPGQKEWVSSGQPNVVILRSIRADPLGWMKSHGHVGEAEYLAGRCWQTLHERSEIGSVQAVNTMKEPVDGGGIPELVTDGQRNALMALRRAALRLEKSVPSDKGRGIARVHLVHSVLSEGKFMRQIAAERGQPTKWAVGSLGKEFKRCLAILAAEFGFAGEPRQKSKIRGWRSDSESNSSEKEIGTEQIAAGGAAAPQEANSADSE